jgi:thioesterase domain-containing protein
MTSPIKNLSPEQKRALLARMLKEREQQKKATLPSYVIPLQPEGSRPPLFCIHPLSGDVLVYITIARHLGTDQPLYGIQAPAFASEVQPLDSVETIATTYLQVLQQVQPAPPYYLAGASFGGIVAFEMARQLAEQDKPVAFLGLLDSVLMNQRATPPIPPLIAELAEVVEQSGQPDAQTWADLTRLVGLIVALFPIELAITHEQIAQQTPERCIPYTMDMMRMANLLPPDVGQANVARYLRVLKAHFAAMQHYVPQEYPGNAFLFFSHEGHSSYLDDPRDTWGKAVGGRLETSGMPGNHLSLLKREHVENLAQTLRTCIEEAQAQ